VSAEIDTATYEIVARGAVALANVLGAGDGSYMLSEPPAALTAMHDWLRQHENVGERDYLRTYREHWADLVEVNGRLDFDKVARELHDYWTAIEQVSRAYDEVTGGRVSKPNTAASYVVQFANERANSNEADDLRDLLKATQDHTDIDQLRAAIRERIAECDDEGRPS
jgi:hypothetical protein